MKKRIWVVGLVCVCAMSVRAGSGTVTWSGGISPDDPTEWTSTNSVDIGQTSNGTVTVSGGAALDSYYSYIGSSSGVTGAVEVTGAGSVWSNSGSMYVGYHGTGELEISDGGAVSDSSGYIGRWFGATGSVTVDDSLWSNSENLYVGYYGDGSLIITNGGRVVADSVEFGVRYETNSTGSIVFGTGGTLEANSFYFSPENLSGSGTALVHGVVADLDLVFDGSSSATTQVDDVSVFVDASSGEGVLGAGYKDSGSLLITNGAVVNSYGGSIGYEIGATGVATVTGAGSIWSNETYLYVGDRGVGTLTITEGGSVFADSVLVGDWNLTNHNGTLVFGSGGMLEANSFYFSASDIHGSGTALVHGVVADLDVVFDGSSVTTSTVEDVSIVIDASSGEGNLGAGFNGEGSLTIANGAVVSSSAGYLGCDSVSTGFALVTGAGSVWSNAGSLSVGYKGTGSLVITNGGRVVAETVSVSGYVDEYGSYRNNDVSDGSIAFGAGGTLEADSFYFSSEDLSGSGTALVHGVVSDLDLVFDGSSVVTSRVDDVSIVIDASGGEGALGIGFEDSGSLLITNGAVVNSFRGYIGYGSGSTGIVTVTGSGSVWSNSNSLILGEDGASELVITNGGAVYNSDAMLCASSDGTCSATVSGHDSLWVSSDRLGLYGSDLTVFDGGTVTVGDSLDVFSGEIRLASGGRIDVAGDAYISSRSTLEFELSGTEESGLLTVGDTLTDSGMTLKLSGGEGLVVGSEYELIQAGSITNTGSALDSSSVLSVYDVTLTQSASNVVVSVDGVQQQSSDAASLMEAAVSSTHVAMSDISNKSRVMRNMLRHQSAKTSAAPSGPSGPDAALAAGQWVGYMRQFNDLGGLDSDGATPGFDWQTSGFMIGFEKRLNEQFVIGLSGGQSWTDLDGLQDSGDGDSSMSFASLYANWFNDTAYYEFGLLCAWGDNDTERTDTALDRYTGGYDSEHIGGWIEAGRRVWESETTALEPYIGTTYVSGHQDGYTDTGGLAPMTVSANGTDNWEVEGGARLTRDWEMTNGSRLSLELKMGIQGELLDNGVTVNTVVAGASQRVSSPDADRMGVILGSRVDVGLTDAINFGVGYEPTFAGNWQNHAVDLMLKVRF